MKALHFDGNLRYIPDYPAPAPGKGEALVRVKMAGICSTDLEILKGYMGFSGIPGHEFVGMVEACDDPELRGRRVVGEINCPCGACAMCRRGLGNHCASRTVLGIQGRDGAFAEYLTLPIDNLHVLPDEVSDAEGVFVEPLAAAFEILEQTGISASDRVVVVGDGRLGILVAQVLKRTGADLTVIGHHKEHLPMLLDLGIDARMEGDGDGPEGADVVVDCSGSPSGFIRSRAMVRPGGRLVLKSTYASMSEVNLSSLVVDEITLIGSRCGPFQPAIRALAEKEVDVSSMMTAVYPMEQGIEAFSRASAPGTLKVFLQIDFLRSR